MARPRKSASRIPLPAANGEARLPKGPGGRQPLGGFTSSHPPDRQQGAAAPVAGVRPVTDFLIWQLMDSAFPTGGFAHSGGLEAAWQHGEVRGRHELVAFLEANLEQWGQAALPFVTAAFDAPERLAEFDKLCQAFTSNHVANRASRNQGRAFWTAVERSFPEGRGGRTEELPCAHFAPVFGACLRGLGVSRETTTRMFMFSQLRAVLAAAVRLNIVGPMEAQRLQYQLSRPAEEVRQRCQTLSLDEIALTAPLLELWQGAQDRLYSRLFQS